MMKNIILIITFLMFLGCKNQKEEIKFQDSKIRDINQIVEAVINEDSLYVSKNDTDSIVFCMDLVKINIQIPTKEKSFEPLIPFNNVSINQLLNLKIGKEQFFLSEDSIYLVSQNLGVEKINIGEEIFNKINLTTIEKELLKRKEGEKYNFYEMTIPVFSKDNSKAYVELNHYCGGLCGSGQAILLSKMNGKWRIIEKYRTWVS